MTDAPTEQPADDHPGTSRRTDLVALATLAALLALTLWNRFHFDGWLARYDLMTFFLPWYEHLGERLRAGDVPGWNPHLFSGAPFAGDPESGWMYLPAMIGTALFEDVRVAFKVMVTIDLAVGAFSVYVYARLLRMRPVAALLTAVLFGFGPLLQWNSYCCLIFGQYVIWIPLALIGIELALRRRGWKERLAPWCLTGFAVSQMFAGWIGEGWIYIPLFFGFYILYRAIISPPEPGRVAKRRLADMFATGVVALGSGALLATAGIWPRFAANAESHLAGARYSELGREGILNPPWELDTLFLRAFGTDYDARRAALGGVALVLALLAPLVAGKRFAVSFFLPVTLIAFILALDTTFLHDIFYLIPRYEDLHEHDPWRTVAFGTLGPAVLAGATLESLLRRGERSERWHGLIPFAVQQLVLICVIALLVSNADRGVEWPFYTAATAATVLVIVLALAPRVRSTALSPRRWAPALLILVAFLQYPGHELTGSWFEWPEHETWERHWRPDQVVQETLASEVSHEDPGGAGEFLQARLAEGEPFRYVGYGGLGYPNDPARGGNYQGRRFEPVVHALLVSGRPVFLDLYEIQGYNPLQLLRYSELVETMNGRPQNYHTAFFLPGGARSPFLDLLHVRYVLVDATIPEDRDDIVALKEGRQEVFRTPLVVVYERIEPLPHAWVVHEVQQVERGDALPLIQNGTVDPYQTALIEGDAPAVAPAVEGATESATVTRYESDRVTLEATAAADGFLVVSEIYEKGWRAYVDGERVEIMPTHHALRGLALPAGTHTVELRYEPVSLRVGLPISVATGLAMLAIFAAAGWSRLRRSTEPAGEASPTPARPWRRSRSSPSRRAR